MFSSIGPTVLLTERYKDNIFFLYVKISDQAPNSLCVFLFANSCKFIWLFQEKCYIIAYTYKLFFQIGSYDIF